MTADGEILVRDAIDTNPDDGIEVAANRLADLVESIGNGHSPNAPARTSVGMGISTAGPLDPETGTYKNPPNLGAWDEKSMKPTLAARLGLPVHVGHDATLAAFAETRFGPHKGAQNLIYVTISTGVGGGIIANGEMVTGFEGHAGEWLGKHRQHFIRVWTSRCPPPRRPRGHEGGDRGFDPPDCRRVRPARNPLQRHSSRIFGLWARATTDSLADR